MPDAPECPECGSTLPADAPRGLCPGCLLGAAFSSNTSPPIASAPAARPGGPGAGPAEPTGFESFRRAILALGLVEPGVLEAHSEAADGDVEHLARALVRAKTLTPYQVSGLRSGKTKGLAIGPYVVLDRLGRGGMGIVFKARRREGGRPVALKILRPSFGEDREAVARFRREFEVAARLAHPNVVAALEADEDRGVPFLTMEYVDGDDLDDLVRAVGPMPLKMALHCAIQAARGLAAAHSAGIVHRDVKPSNLMLDREGVVRVLDLGLARVIEASDPLAKGSAGALTHTGSYMGTVDYIAPEQADDPKRADHRADIYGLGCTLHFLLAGRPPFEGETALKRLIAHQQRPAPPLSDARDDVPEALEAVYARMLAKSPDDRPRSMQEVIERLESCRRSPDEAIEAQRGLTDFATTVLKRAAPRKRGWGVDASVFARPGAHGGLRFEPDLDLEDVIADVRLDVPAKPLTEAQLPPAPPRIAPARKKPRRPRPSRAPVGLLASAAMLVAAYGFYARSRPALPPIPKAEATAAAPGPAPSSAPSPSPAKSGRFAESIGLRIVPIRPGEFRMGTSDEEEAILRGRFPEFTRDAFDQERPAHRVRLTKIRGMSAHEVTIGQFRRFVEETGYRPASERDPRGAFGNDPVTWKYGRDPKFNWRGPGIAQGEDHPVACVDWFDAVEFCRWLSEKDGRNFRLPTEAEWEYCCRGGTGTVYAHGNDPDTLARIGNVGDLSLKVREPNIDTTSSSDGFIATAPVGRFAPNAWGLHDMHGNVWEWCLDHHDPAYYAGSPVEDPPGASASPHRVVRGGSWFDSGKGSRSATRNRLKPDFMIANLGFRVAEAAPEP